MMRSASAQATGPYTPNVTQALQVQRNLLKTCGGELWPPRQAPGRLVERKVEQAESTVTSLPTLPPTRLFVAKEPEKNANLSFYLDGFPKVANSSARFRGSYGPDLRERVAADPGLAKALQDDSLVKLDETEELVRLAQFPQWKKAHHRLSEYHRPSMCEEMYKWQQLAQLVMETTPVSPRSESSQESAHSEDSDAGLGKGRNRLNVSSQGRWLTSDPSPALRETWTTGFFTMTGRAARASASQQLAFPQYKLTRGSFSTTIDKLTFPHSEKGAKASTQSLKGSVKGPGWIRGQKSPLRQALAASTSQRFQMSEPHRNVFMTYQVKTHDV